MKNIYKSGLTNKEVKERSILLELQKNRTRWFSKEEFKRLKELSHKMFINQSPTEKKES